MIAVILLPAVASAQMSVGASGDEGAIRKIGEAYEAAWRSGNLGEISALFTEGGTFRGVAGDLATGREELERQVSALREGVFKGTVLRIVFDSIDFIKPDVAVGRGTFEFLAGAVPEGVARKGHWMNVFVKSRGEWRIRAGQAMAPAGPPK
jgi:uncharacterized protein (TIGR02246 family)